jgi:hypothetical protein
MFAPRRWPRTVEDAAARVQRKTRSSVTLMQQHEKYIANAIFAGADAPSQIFNYPSDLDAHFNLIAKRIAETPDLEKDIPDLHNLLQNVMTKLEGQPVNVEVVNPLTRQPLTVKIGSFGLAYLLRMDIDDATDIPVIPRLLYSIDQGDPSILRWFVQKRIVIAFAIPGNGLNKAMSVGISSERLKRIQQEAEISPFKDVVNFPFMDVMEVWPEQGKEEPTDQVIKSKIRTLFLTGELDCRTPSSQTEMIRKGFVNSTHLVVKNAGHEQILDNFKIRQAIIDFLSGKDVSKVEASFKPLIFIPVNGESPDSSHPALH